MSTCRDLFQHRASSGLDITAKLGRRLTVQAADHGKPTELHPCPAPDELTSVGKLPLCTDSHIIGLPIPAVVKSTFDATDTRNAGEHTLDFYLEIRQRVTHR